MKKRVLITGATAGIGEATAHKLAESGFDLIITGRRMERLETLAKTLQQNYQTEVQTLCFDIRNRQQVEEALSSLPADKSKIDILVNNAGLAIGYERFDECNPSDWDTMIDTNIKGALYMAQAVSKQMVSRGEGLIINIGSIAGMQALPNGVVYSTTKAALHAMSLGMRVDLLPFGIRVCELRPGNTMTEFVDVRSRGDLSRKETVYAGLNPLHADDIAEAIRWMANLPENININEIEITPQRQANVNHLIRK